MADMTGMFGLTPDQVLQQQNAGLDDAALQYAKLDPFQRANMGMFRAGAGLANIAAPALGLENPAMRQAQQVQQATQGIDTTTPEGLKELSRRFNSIGMPSQAIAAMTAARDLELKKAETAYKTAQATDIPQMKQEEALAKLEQREREMRMRSEDMRYAADQRAAAAREANQTRMMIAQIMQSMRIDKPMSAQQAQKLKKDMAADAAAVRSLDTDLQNAKTAAEILKTHPGLEGATGAQSYIPSFRSSQAAKAETLLDEFKATVKEVGLNLVRQGGGIGAMTEKEWPIVEAMVASINPKGGAEQVRSQIDKVTTKMEQIRNNAQRKFDETYSGMEVTTSAEPASATIAEFVRDPKTGKLVRK